MTVIAWIAAISLAALALDCLSFILFAAMGWIDE